MSHQFLSHRPHVGGELPHHTFGRLVAIFQSASPIPLRGGKNTGRHIYLALKVPDGGKPAGVYECAVNVRSDEGTNVLFAERIEEIATAPTFGFTANPHLSYGTGDAPGVDFIGLTQTDFAPTSNMALENRIRDLSAGCDHVEAYGVTYTGGDGLHDVHMNSGTDPSDPHHAQDRDHQDGAIAFHYALTSGGTTKRYAHWIFVKFATQTIP